jgi:hypothetical protein
MSRNRENMQKLVELRDRLASDLSRHQQAIEAIRNQLLGVEAAIKTVGPDVSGPRRNVKRTVMELVQEAAKAGITAAEVVDRAKVKGRDLDKASVSSLLSRFKRDGTLTFDGERYYPTTVPAQEPAL